MRIAYFDCFAGISGDMALGALVDTGADFEALKAELGKLHLHEFEIGAAKVVKRGVSATDVTVTVHNGDHSRGFSDITRVIEESGVPDEVKSRSIAIFRRLGEAEARIHGTSIEEVHFHEVGAVDAIVDIVGVCVCLSLLGVERVCASPVPTFHGSAKMAHGTLPLPAPATIELLKGAPWRELGIEGEIVTPTGAAILAGLNADFGSMPAMKVESVGYGAGKKDFGPESVEGPNVLRVMVGEELPLLPGGGRGEVSECEDVFVLETNIDDMSPQVYDALMDRLFAAGALDVYLTPIQMKKNRPAVLVSVICSSDDADRMSEIIFEETSTIGIRIDRRSRICLPREMVTVETRFGQIRLKLARRGGEVVNAQPEYDDCKSAAAAHSVPVKLVRDCAVAAFVSSQSRKPES